MKEVLDAVRRWRAEGKEAALGTVVRVKMSAPRPPGAKMGVSSSGELVGAVSGGCVEGAVVQVAEDILAGKADPQVLHFGIADAEAWDVGLPCGGEIDVFVDPYASPEQEAFAELADGLARGALVTNLSDARRILMRDDGSTVGSLGSPEADAEARTLAEELMWEERSELRGDWFVDAVFPPPRLIIFGAIDFAAQLCSLARTAGWRPYVVDPRARFATPERFPDAEAVIAGWPDAAVEQLGGIDRATSIAVVTHDPKLDDAALVLALRADTGYIGAMGSRRAQARRRERLLSAGVAEEELERISAPIGLDLGALTPSETAVSIMAEVVAVRRGRSGGRLRDAAGRIHEVA